MSESWAYHLKFSLQTCSAKGLTFQEHCFKAGSRANNLCGHQILSELFRSVLWALICETSLWLHQRKRCCVDTRTDNIPYLNPGPRQNQKIGVLLLTEDKYCHHVIWKWNLLPTTSTEHWVTARRESCHELRSDWMGAANQDYKRAVNKTEPGEWAFCVLRGSSGSHQNVKT